MRERSCYLLLVIAAAVFVISGCAGKSGTCASPDKEVGLTLTYKMAEGVPLKYVFTSDFSQTMEIRGEQVPIQTVEVLTFSVLPSGMMGSDYAIGVTIDDMALTIQTPQGDMAPDVAGVVGGSFEMSLSGTGEEGNLPDPETLQFSAGPEGPRSLIPSFSVMFPDLPGKPIMVGDTWPSDVNLDQSEGEGTSMLQLSTVNTLDGFETFQGRECARITSTFTGLITGSGTEQGAQWTMESDTEGTGVCYFDFKNGVLVSDSSTGTADGTITVNSPQGEMVIPVSRNYTMISKLAE
ncbi:MAG: hypothetical protein JXB46_11065 [Candidatus Eisenbacteria bacterium]|nr:hypothetical protein [Candidatus Eisenbacteria bacterium]